MSKKLIESSFMIEVVEIIKKLYNNNWDERNGGNITYLLSEKELRPYENELVVGEIHDLYLNTPNLNNKIYLVTRTGIYFRNITKDLKQSFGIIKILESGKKYQIIWGLNENGLPTSELSSHLLGHSKRLEIDECQKVIIHSHPTNLIAMSFIHDLDSILFSKTLWKMMTECVVVFPDGIGVLPWMVCGNDEIGVETAELFKQFHMVLWALHGVLIAGDNLDEVFGILETAEKAAEIYMKIRNNTIINMISDQDLKALTNAFNVKTKKEYLE